MILNERNDVHGVHDRDDGKRFVVHADEKLTASAELRFALAVSFG